MPFYTAKAIEDAGQADRLVERRTDCGAGMNVQRTTFAQQKQSEYVIEVRIGKKNSGDGCVSTGIGKRLQIFVSFDLGS